MFLKAAYCLLVLYFCISDVNCAIAKFENIDKSFQTPHHFAQPRTESSGRSLILKSILLAPIGIALIAVAVAILFLPIPAITLPAGRMLAENRALQTVQNVLTSEECVERISCELSNMSRTFEFTAWIPKTIEKHFRQSQWGEKVSKGMMSSKPCRQFACHPTASFKRSFLKN